MHWCRTLLMVESSELKSTQLEETMTEAAFHWKYGGPAVANGTMDVRDLAPALLAVGDSCARANKIINGDSCRIQVNVNAGFERGSFDVLLTLISTPQAQMVIDHISDANELLRFLGYGGGASGVVMGAVHLYKWLRGRTPDRVEAVGDDKISIHIGDNSVLVFRPTYNLLRDSIMQEQFKKAVEPLAKDGIDTLAIGPDVNAAAILGKEDLESFAEFTHAAPEQPEVFVNHVHGPYVIAAVPFESGLVWRLRHPDEDSGRFTARMADEEFQAKINDGQQSFAKGDILVIDLLVENEIVDGVPKTEYTIERVHRHIRPRRSSLPELPMPPSNNTL